MLTYHAVGTQEAPHHHHKVGDMEGGGAPEGTTADHDIYDPYGRSVRKKVEHTTRNLYQAGGGILS
jgi:hypothetical protein